MTRDEIFEYQLQKRLSPNDYNTLTPIDKQFGMDKAIRIVTNYLHRSPSSALDYLLVDIAIDIIDNEILATDSDSMLPNVVSSIREGDTTIQFATTTSATTDTLSGKNSAVYLNSYTDELNRFRVMK